MDFNIIFLTTVSISITINVYTACSNNDLQLAVEMWNQLSTVFSCHSLDMLGNRDSMLMKTLTYITGIVE